MMETVIVLKPQTEWRKSTRWYSTGRPSGASRSSGRITPDQHLDRRAGRRDERSAARSPASRTPGRCRSRTASTCSPPASARRSASRSSAPTSTRSSRSAQQIERVLPRRARHAQRLRRARGRRLLPRLRPEARRAGALRPDGGRCPDGRDDRHRRRNVTTTVEGRERYPVNVRYLRDYRSDLDALRRVLVPTHAGSADPAGADRRHPAGQAVPA